MNDIQLGNIGDDDEATDGNDLIAGLHRLHERVAENQVQGARHRARGNLVRVLLELDSLPVRERGSTHFKGESRAIVAFFVCAASGLGELELLLDRADTLATHIAHKTAGHQLGLDVCCTSDSARNAHQTTNVLTAHLAKRVHLPHVHETHVHIGQEINIIVLHITVE